jgi:hypothetical protein
MQNKELPQAERLGRKNRRRKIWHRLVSLMACIVVFVTTYALILPAITMAKTAYCGIEEHHHTAECFEKRLICGFDAAASPVLSEASGFSESTGLSENSETADAAALPETQSAAEMHTHTDACYENVLIWTTAHMSG